MARGNRIRPLEARRAMKALTENPDDTAQAFRVIGALSGNSGARLFRRFRRSSEGARVLREERELFSVLDDVERLKAMPEGSLGAAIADYFITEELSAQGLADASEILRRSVVRTTTDTLDLSNNLRVATYPCRPAAIRGLRRPPVVQLHPPTDRPAPCATDCRSSAPRR